MSGARQQAGGSGRSPIGAVERHDAVDVIRTKRDGGEVSRGRPAAG